MLKYTRMKTAAIAPIISLGAFLAPATWADTLGLYAGYGVWSADIAGQIADNGRNVDLRDELNLNMGSNDTAYIAIEHPIPLLPNARLQYSDLSTSGVGTITQAFEFDGETFTADTEVTTDLDLTHTDATLYYQLWDTVGGLDLGMTLRVFDGSATLAGDNGIGGTVRVSQDFTAPVPMLYGRIGFKLPLTGLTADARVNYIDVSDDKVLDAVARINYETLSGLGIEAGYRSFDIDIEDEGLIVDSKIDGFYAGISYHF